MLKKLFNLFAKPITTPTDNDYSLEDVYSSPELLFRYINTNQLNAESDSDNALHIQKLRKKYTIPAHCADQYIRERKIVKIAGILFYVKPSFSETFYSTLRGYFVDALFNERANHTPMLERDEVDQVLRFYESEEDPYEYTEFFLSRVFGGLSIIEDLKGSDLILNITFNYMLAVAEIMHDDHQRALGESTLSNR